MGKIIAAWKSLELRILCRYPQCTPSSCSRKMCASKIANTHPLFLLQLCMLMWNQCWLLAVITAKNGDIVRNGGV